MTHWWQKTTEISEKQLAELELKIRARMYLLSSYYRSHLPANEWCQKHQIPYQELLRAHKERFEAMRRSIEYSNYWYGNDEGFWIGGFDEH